MNTETLKFKQVRAGWYETADEVEGAYVIYCNGPRSWSVCQYPINKWFPSEFLDLVTIETSGTFADAKHLANHDNHINNIRKELNA